ncbi:MAG TPA: DNA-3-methyladenine glycosylase I [Flavobacterium sp.]|nr:DNA-3-methyladenine glycosylase I [Flavobacterium sp.]
MDNKKRCSWCGTDVLYQNYHDTEWGRPIYDDQLLFEFLILEGFQAGLSWLTILRRREGFRSAFDRFDYTIIANYGEQKLSELITDDRIIKNKLKINAAVSNAKAFMQVQDEFGSFSNYIWSFTNGQPLVNSPKTHADIPAQTPLSIVMSKDLKKRGFKFVGPTIMYAFMQAVGIVDDHISDCWVK